MVKTQPSTTADISILKNPRITEKAANAQALRTYTFDIAVGVTKNEVAKAFVAKYKVTPTKVRTLNITPKTYFRRGKLGVGTRAKKAYITLPKGKTIDII